MLNKILNRFSLHEIASDELILMAYINQREKLIYDDFN